jgi:hypothetical protein
MKNQAVKFISIQAKDEWYFTSYQQEYQKDYTEDDNHVQGLIWNAPFCSACISHRNKDVYKSYTLFLGLRDGSNDATRRRNLSLRVLIKSKLEEAD